MQQRFVESPVYLRAQPAYVNINDIGLGVEMIIPDVFQKHRSGDHLPAVPHQVFEQAKLPRLQVNGLVGPLYFPREDT